MNYKKRYFIACFIFIFILPVLSELGTYHDGNDNNSSLNEPLKNYFRLKLYSQNNKFNNKKEAGKPIFPSGQDTGFSNVRLSITTLAAGGIEQNEVNEISKIIYSRLVLLKGEEYVIYRLVDGSKKKANRALSGRVSRLGSARIVSVSVNDVESGKLLFNQTVKINENDPVKSIVESIADKIATAEDIW